MLGVRTLRRRNAVEIQARRFDAHFLLIKTRKKDKK